MCHHSEDAQHIYIRTPAIKHAHMSMHPHPAGAAFLARVCQYLETPQYLRKALVPMHPDLRLAVRALRAPVRLLVCSHSTAGHAVGVCVSKRVWLRGMAAS